MTRKIKISRTRRRRRRRSSSGSMGSVHDPKISLCALSYLVL